MAKLSNLAKWAKGLYIRFGNNPFVWLLLFIYQATHQNKTQRQISQRLTKTKIAQAKKEITYIQLTCLKFISISKKPLQ